MPDRFPTRGEIVSNQLRQLRELLAAIIPANRFYVRKLFGRAAGKSQRKVSAPAIKSLEEFAASIPFTTKQELVDDQIAAPPYGTNLSFPLERYIHFHQTSGTTGLPLRWLDTAESWDWMVGNWQTIFRAAQVKPGDRVCFAFSFGPFIGFWLAFDAAQKLGCLCLPAGSLSSEARLKLILENEVTVLCCTPTYALRLGEVAVAEKFDLGKSKVRTIIVAGEPGGSIPATRARIEKLWRGARVFDHHGMTETGPVTYECPAHPGLLHIIESGYIAEIINPVNGESVKAGEQGELILTTLGRTGSPLLRYRTGDLVKQKVFKDSRCRCGSHEMALDGGIRGRVDDMVIVRGVNVYPAAVEEVIRSCGGIAEFQGCFTNTAALAELSVIIEPSPACKDPAALAKRLGKMLQSAFNLRVPVKVVPKGTLPRFEMKARRWGKATV